jgi:hypothetical protein
MKRAAVALTILLGCGGGPSETADGLDVQVHSTQPWLKSVDVRATVDAMIDRQAVELRVARPRLDGWRLLIVDGPISCGAWDGGRPVFGGCTHFEERTITVSADHHPSPGADCLAATALPHEIGHALLWTAEHSDPRWVEVDSIWRKEIAARCGP